MNKGKTHINDVDDGLVIGCESTSSGQKCLPSIPSGNHLPSCVASQCCPDHIKPSSVQNNCSQSNSSSSTCSTSNLSNPASEISTTNNHEFSECRYDKDSKSKNRSQQSRLEKCTAFVTSPQFAESLKSQIVINGASSYLNQDAFYAQVRTIMKAAGLVDNVSNRCKLKNNVSSRYPSVRQLVSPHKMTLMAELFDSEDEDGEEEIYDDDVDDQLDIENHDQMQIEEVDYDDDDEEEVDDEELNRDAGDDGDDEDDNSEIESLTIEDESSQDSKILSVVAPDFHEHGAFYKSDMAYANLPETLSSAVCVDQNTDSALYQQLNYTPSDVHCVMDEVQATIEKMRSSDQLSYIQKLQEGYHAINSNRVSGSFSTTVPSEDVCIKSSVQLCHVPSTTPFVSDNDVDKEVYSDSPDNGNEPIESLGCSDQSRSNERQRKDPDQIIILAATTGHVDMVQYLVNSQNLNLNKLGSKDTTALMEAASAGYFDIVVILYEHGADVNIKTPQGNTALMYACANGNLDIVEYLILRGANIEDQNENGHTALMEAASSGHVEVARFLVSQGCNINVHSNEYKETALTLAAYKGHLEMVRFLIEVGVQQEHRAEEMHTALMEASMDGHVEVARLLIDSGAQVNMPPDSFESPLTLAACGGHVELALLLLECGANIEEVNDEGYTALMEAAREGHEEMVALLISNDAQINATTEDSKETALSMACGAGCLEVVNLLIKAGADIELGSNTPLMEAAQEGHLEIVKRLIQAGANVNAANNSETALTLASENGYLKVVKCLIAHCAKVDFCVEGGRTALMKAAQANRIDTVLSLIASGADVNKATTNNEHTPLSLACSAGHSQVVKILLNSGADQFHRLKDNSTMLIEAAKGGHTPVVRILFDYQCLHVNLVENALANSKSKPKKHLQSAKSNQLGKMLQPKFGKSQKSVLQSNVKVSPKVSSPSQTLSPHIKVVDNSTFKLVNSRTPPSKKVSLTDSNNYKVVRNKFVYIPQHKKSTSQVNSKHSSQSNLSHIDSIRTKSSRSLSDSFIYDCEIQSLCKNNDDCTSNSSVTIKTPANDDLLAKIELPCKEFILIYNKMIASVFFSIFNFFRNPILDPILTDIQLLDGLIEEIDAMLQNEDLVPPARKWLRSRLKVVNDFKQRNFFFHQMKHVIIKKVKIESESDIIIPGIVLKNFLNCKNILNKLQLDSATIDYCQMFFSRSQYIDSESEIHDSISDTQFSVDYTDSGCQTDPVDYTDLEQQACVHKENVLVKDDDSKVNSECEKSTESKNNSLKKISELNPEQIIFSITNGNIRPKQYINDQLFELLKKLSLFYLAPNKKELVFDLLYLLNKSPPEYQHIIRPLISEIHKIIREQVLDDKSRDESLCSSSGHSSKENLHECRENSQTSNTDDVDVDVHFESNNLSAFSAVKPSQNLPIEVASTIQQELTKDSNYANICKLATSDCAMTQEQLNYLRNHLISDEAYPFSFGRILPELNSLTLSSRNDCEKASVDDETSEQIKSPNINTLFSTQTVPNNVERLSQLKEEIESHSNRFCTLTDEFFNRVMNEPFINPNISFSDIQDNLNDPDLSQEFIHEVLTNVHEYNSSFAEVLSDASKCPGYLPFPNVMNINFPSQFASKEFPSACNEHDSDSSTSNSKNAEIFEYIKSLPSFVPNTFPSDVIKEASKADVSESSLLPTAATVSINTNTTSTATTAVCVMPQANSSPETTSFAQFKKQHIQKISQYVGSKLSLTNAKPTNHSNNIVSQQSKIETDQPTTTFRNELIQLQTANSLSSSHPSQQEFNPGAAAPQVKSKSSLFDLNFHDSNHDTALTVACAGGHEEIVLMLINRGADIEHRDMKGMTSLMLAATNGHAKIVEILFSHGANLEAQKDKSKDTALSLACSSGRYDVVEMLLSKGANKEHRNVSDYTPLSLAAAGGYVEIIKLLLSNGAEINSRTGSKLGISPLMLAAMNGHTETARLLLDRGSDINAYIETNKNTALTLACFQGRTDVVRLLLERNANIEHRAKTGLTPLMEAASGGYVEVGQVLLAKGAEVNSAPVPATRDTALITAADKGHSAFVDLLIKAGAFVDAKNKKGYSALWVASSGGHLEVVHSLVNAKCDVDSQDNRKISCLMVAFRNGHVKVVKYLVRHVTQFPSDQEINRSLTLCTDEELNKKVMICSGIIRFAKDRQAAEALKNAANLLEEIDMERSREENRKAAAARRRERRKQKKKKEKAEHQVPEDMDKNSLKDGDEDVCDIEHKDIKGQHDANDENDYDEITAATIDLDDYDSMDDLYDELSHLSIIKETPVAKKNKKKKKSKTVEEKHEKEKESSVSQSTLSAETSQTKPPSSDKKSSKKNKASKLQSETESRSSNDIGDKEVIESVSLSKDPVVSPPKKSDTSNNGKIDVSVIKDADNKSKSYFENEEILFNSLSTSPVSLTTNTKPIKVITSANRAKTNSKNSNTAANGVTGQTKRDEGWKEVVRKSKKVLVPNNAISRVIGRHGCNINTIREISGAHIEVEKQKGQGDRMVIIRGSADATRNAHQLITTLSKEADKDLSEIIRQLGLTKSESPSSPTFSVSSANPSLSSTDEILPIQMNLSSSEPLESSSVTPNLCHSQSQSLVTPSACRQFSKTNRTQQPSVSKNVTSTTAGKSPSTVHVHHLSQISKPTTYVRNANKKEELPSIDSKQTSQTISASSTSNTVSYTMAVNSKTRSINSSVGSNKMSNGVKIMSAVFKPSNKSQIHSNSYSANRSYYNQSYPKPDADFKHSGQNANNHQRVGIDNDSNKALYDSSANSIKTDPEQVPTGNMFNIWQKSNEKPNFASVAASGVSSMLSHSSSSSSLNSKQNVEISIDEGKQPLFNRQYVSPGSMSASSHFNTASTLSINTSTTMSAHHSLGPIGNVRSAPCTPPMSNSTSNYGRSNKHTSHQQPINDSHSTLRDSISPPSKSSLMDNLLTNTNCDSTSKVNDFYLPNQSNHMQANSFYPSSISSDDSVKHANNNSNMSNQSVYNSSYRSINNYMDLAHPTTLYNSDQNISKSSIRSNLNPNAPDFATRSNSFSTNTISQQPMMNFSTNSIINGTMSTIPSTGFSNMQNIPARPPYAPPISNAAVRVAIVNYSMNVFQNQVPKQHQEAAARLAHLSAQNSNFVNSDFQNVFIPNNGNNISNDKMRMMQYAMNHFKQPTNSTNGNSFPTLNPSSNFGAISRVSNSGSISTSAYSMSNYVSTTESLNVVTSTIDMNYNGPVLINTSSSIEHLTPDDCNNIQRNKHPAPIGTERAQRKNPNYSISPQQANMSPFVSNPPQVNSNAMFAEPSLQWNLSSNSEDSKNSGTILQSNRLNNPFGSSNVDLILPETSLSNFFIGIEQSNTQSQQSPSHSRLNIDGFNSTFDSSNQISNTFNGLNHLNLNNTSVFGFGQNVTNIDSDYWSSSTSSSSSITKLTSNCSTSGPTSGANYESKILWNNWSS